MLKSAELLNGPGRPESFAHWKTANGPGKQRLVARPFLCLPSITVREITDKKSSHVLLRYLYLILLLYFHFPFSSRLDILKKF